MSWLSGLVVYVILWWLVFFMALPVGVRSQAEEAEEGRHELVPGSTESAPVKPRLWVKALATSLIALVLFGIVYFMMINDWFGLVQVRPA